jgi:tetratricopeptide (TPR) repeat protein
VNPDDLADLEEQRAFLVRSLDDLDRELAAGDLDALDAATLHDDYQRRLDEVQAAIDTGVVALAEARPRRPARMLAIVGVVVVLALGAGFGVAFAAGSRTPSDTATGNIREGSIDKLTRAAQLAQDEEFIKALELYDEILADDPENVEALSEKGLLLVSLAQAAERPTLAEQGERSIRAALALEPDNARALFYLGLALRLQGDDAGAKQAWDDALAANPPAGLRRTIQQFRASIGS